GDAPPSGSRSRLKGLPGPTRTGTPAQRGVVSHNDRRSRGAHLVHSAVTACPRGNDVPGNRHTVRRGHGAPVRSGLLAPAGINGTGTRRLAEALTRLPTAVATAWRAAG